MYLFFFLICFFASGMGAICGIGGGVIIKPVLDAFDVMDVAVISFLSGCTVLSMTTYSVAKSKLGGESKFSFHVGVPLAGGAAIGGVVGKVLFEFIRTISGNANIVGAVQSICLFLVTVGTLIYTINKEKIETRKVKKVIPCIVIGFILGLMSSFLGIGGGPINLVVLFYFFSMTTKEAVENSLYIIWFSQTASLLQSVFTGNIPDFPILVMVFMVAGGIVGGIIGRWLNKKMKDEAVDKLFIALMVFMLFINIFNIYNFSIKIY